jgi:hypothetical protein
MLDGCGTGGGSGSALVMRGVQPVKTYREIRMVTRSPVRWSSTLTESGQPVIDTFCSGKNIVTMVGPGIASALISWKSILARWKV